MKLATTSGRTYFENVDDYLGPTEQRFFGAGFRRADHAIRDITVRDGRLDARATVRYPADWSTKDGVDQSPHLSTVDVLVLGAQLAEIHLARTWELNATQRRQMWLRQVRIQAGRTPLEEGLDDVPMSATGGRAEGRAQIARFAYSGVDCRVGPLRVHCGIEHPVTDRPPGGGDPVAFASAEEALGNAAWRYYGGLFRAHRTSVQHVTIERDSSRVSAVAHLTSTIAGAGEGLDGFRQPSISKIDCFTTGLQLGQVLLYELDGLTRGTSNTLWMRQTWLESASPERGAAGPQEVRTHLDNVKLLERGPRDVWRTADIVTELSGISMRCSVAHRLPAGVPG